MYPVITRIGLPDTGNPSPGFLGFIVKSLAQARIDPGVWAQPVREVAPSVVGQPDLGPPSPAWMTRVSVLPVTVAQEPRISLVDPIIPPPVAPADTSQRIDWISAAIRIVPPVTVAQYGPGLGAKADMPLWTPGAPDTYPPSLGWIRSTFAPLTLNKIAAVFNRPLDPVPFVPQPPELPTAPGWIFWFIFVPSSKSAARETTEVFRPVPLQPDWPSSVGWIVKTFVPVTTPKLAGVFAQSKAADAWTIPPWLYEPAPFNASIFLESFKPATAAQLAGVFSQSRQIDPGIIPPWLFEPGPNTGGWTFLFKPVPPSPVPGKLIIAPRMRRLELLGIRWSTT